MLQNFILNVNSMKYVVKHTCFLKFLWMVEFERSVMFTFTFCSKDKFAHLCVSCICMFSTSYISGTFQNCLCNSLQILLVNDIHKNKQFNSPSCFCIVTCFIRVLEYQFYVQGAIQIYITFYLDCNYMLYFTK